MDLGRFRRATTADTARTDGEPSLQRTVALVGVVIVLILGAITLPVVITDAQTASTVANLASGIGSLFLVLLTGWYTLLTRGLMQAEYDARKTERVEDWYGDTLSIVRQLESEIQFLYRYNVDEEGEVKLQEHEEALETLRSLITALQGQVSKRPQEIDADIMSPAEEAFEHWRLMARSDNPILDFADPFPDAIQTLREEIEADSDWYGNEDDM